MLSTSHVAVAGRLLGVAGVLAIVACSDGASGPTAIGSSPPASSVIGSTGDTTRGPTTGEWHLATIRGLAIGVDRITANGSVDTSAAKTTALAGAKVEIRKVQLLPAVGFAPMGYQDIGIVATVTADAAGKFEYVLSDPIVVKSGQPSPMISYRVTITPTVGSPFAKGDLQVYFVEQFPSGIANWNYFLFR
ncbi:MAG TPA: hypothetical protein VK636_03115 [Gemmatimonadaceae bacterium]|nr:hypothetical protein [Gemmatimonadaceae bacterium]